MPGLCEQVLTCIFCNNPVTLGKRTCQKCHSRLNSKYVRRHNENKRYCIHCSTILKYHQGSFCSSSCAMLYRHLQAGHSKSMIIIKDCPICGREFKCNTRRITKTCSSSCGGKMATLTRRLGLLSKQIN